MLNGALGFDRRSNRAACCSGGSEATHTMGCGMRKMHLWFVHCSIDQPRHCGSATPKVSGWPQREHGIVCEVRWRSCSAGGWRIAVEVGPCFTVESRGADRSEETRCARAEGTAAFFFAADGLARQRLACERGSNGAGWVGARIELFPIHLRHEEARLPDTKNGRREGDRCGDVRCFDGDRVRRRANAPR